MAVLGIAYLLTLAYWTRPPREPSPRGNDPEMLRAYHKIERTITSCMTMAQLAAADMMVKNFYEFWKDDNLTFKLNKLIDQRYRWIQKH